jgi:polysaccharide biosynthesis protein PslG
VTVPLALVLAIAPSLHALGATLSRTVLTFSESRAQRGPQLAAQAAACPPRVPVRLATARRSSGRFARVNNQFGQRIFGVAAGGAIQEESPRAVRDELSADHEAGAQWVRIDINWASIQAGGPNGYNWRATDRVIRDAAACGLQVLGVIMYTPSWARPSGTDSTWRPSPGAYARFAYAAARRYRARGVYAFEIWNEENTGAFWKPRPSPRDYTRVLRAAYGAIKRADPSGIVVTGGTAPAPSNGTDYSPISFLKGIYRNGGRNDFDAVGHHPYCWPAFPGERRRWSAWYQMYGMHPSLRSVMIAHGDRNKKIWATEFGAPTDGPPGTHVSQSTQAAMVAKSFQLFASYPWAGPLFVYQGRDRGTDTSTNANFFGFLSRDFIAKPAFDAYVQSTGSSR